MSAPIIALAPDLPDAMGRVRRAGLFDHDETRSQVLLLLEHEPHDIRQIWLATDPDSGKDVGMAMVSSPASDSQGRPVLNLVVDVDCRGQGVGRRLLDAVLEQHAPSGLAAYYTTNAVRLYRAVGFPPAELHWNADIEAANKALGFEGACEAFIQAVLQEREELDRAEAGYLARRPGPRS